MLLALVALAVLAPGSFSPDEDPYHRDPLLLAPSEAREARDACGGRQGFVGDGEDGRDPPPCEEADADGGADPAGLHEPDWLRTVEEGDGD